MALNFAKSYPLHDDNARNQRRGFNCVLCIGSGRSNHKVEKKKKQKREPKSMSFSPPSSEINGISDDLKKIIDANMDEAPNRRHAREAFKKIQLSIDHCLFKAPTQGLKIDEGYEKNSRGLQIFYKSWLPESSPPKALICFCHGYGDTCTFFFEGIARKLALAGYGVCAMDYPGFGLSDGLHGYIKNFDQLVDDVIEHYSKIKEKPEFRNRPFFLFGQSMGGAVALKIHLKQPKAWNGAVLVAPMCKIADDMYPPFILTQILISLAKVFPKWKMVPQKDLADIAFREKKELANYNVIAYKDKPRLKTAVEMLRTTDEIASRLEEVSMPFLILHGEADIVTNPSVSKALYEKASSKDKKLLLCKDSYHAILEGEPDDVIERVFGDIISWLDEHSTENAAQS
ncbi:caffeoylshikimate esterase isoform X1 [Amaranthus tricolor]|uniref:caffeoylshikimate esterase isoform X1 n=2 Tax=Amaranthus tricolor TaxID=29722 RepID=UPI002589F347|nr:caffeoylshikimate esterase isoform X1 [Amaranthus tricolor]